MDRFIYTTAIRIYGFLIGLAAFFYSKAKAWKSGRQQIDHHLLSLDKGKPLIWMHCASLGEFEQGRPILEQLNIEFPDHQLLLTFFSPSGFSVRKNYQGADLVTYIPLDTLQRANKFIQTINPDFVIFVKYEFWLNHLELLFKKQIPVYLIAAHFRSNQIFFKWYGGLFKKTLERYRQIFVQTKSDQELLRHHQINHCLVAGDPRIDRVADIAANANEDNIVKAFKGQDHLLIAGSTWPKDEKILMDALSIWPDQWKLIIAPHDIQASRIEEIEQAIGGSSVRYSHFDSISDAQKKILIVDNIGKLSSIYRYGTIAYVGGGFGAGIHNVLEPAAHGLPVLFGPKHEKFPEAVALIDIKAGFCIHNRSTFREVFDLLNDQQMREKSANTAQQFVKKHSGATEIIINQIKINEKY